jgi:hypothetical protein
LRDGRKRTLEAVHRDYGRDRGGWTEMIVIRADGRPTRSYGTVSGWTRKASAEVAKGGSYVRAGGEGL